MLPMQHQQQQLIHQQSDGSMTAAGPSAASGGLDGGLDCGLDGKNNKMYRCKTCNEEFVHRNVLKTHNELMHSSVRVPCDKCDKTFTTKSSLRLHKEAIHDGIRYQCTFCDKSFGQLGSLRRHIKSIHPSMKIGGGNAIVRTASDKTQISLHPHVANSARAHRLAHNEDEVPANPQNPAATAAAKSSTSATAAASASASSAPASPPLAAPLTAATPVPSWDSGASLAPGDASPRSTGSESTASLMSMTASSAAPAGTLFQHNRKRSAGDLLGRWPAAAAGSPPKQQRRMSSPPATIFEDEQPEREMDQDTGARHLEKALAPLQQKHQHHHQAQAFTHSESEAIAILACLQMRAR